jgi:hypothetical protein
MTNPRPSLSRPWILIVILGLAVGGLYYWLLRELAASGFLPAKVAQINVLLSGDTAVVIAMACLRLPPRQRLWGMILCTAAVLRMVVAVSVTPLRSMTRPGARHRPRPDAAEIDGGRFFMMIPQTALEPDYQHAVHGARARQCESGSEHSRESPRLAREVCLLSPC